MYKLTRAYKIWKSAPQNIQDATCPIDFAKGRELHFLIMENRIAHIIQHVKQYTHFHLGIPRKLKDFCSCSEFEDKGL